MDYREEIAAEVAANKIVVYGKGTKDAPRCGFTLETIERVAIKQTVIQSGGNKVHAARTLGIAPSTLYEKLRKYGI